MEVQIAVAKVNKYATSESGDTLEVIERPNGGFSVVLANGQTSHCCIVTNRLIGVVGHRNRQAEII